ncbi:MAG: hypothetical protein AVDCRST_MAG32-2248, partial [uncultured Nocardioides sp.]
DRAGAAAQAAAPHRLRRAPPAPRHRRGGGVPRAREALGDVGAGGDDDRAPRGRPGHRSRDAGRPSARGPRGALRHRRRVRGDRRRPRPGDPRQVAAHPVAARGDAADGRRALAAPAL